MKLVTPIIPIRKRFHFFNSIFYGLKRILLYKQLSTRTQYFYTFLTFYKQRFYNIVPKNNYNLNFIKKLQTC